MQGNKKLRCFIVMPFTYAEFNNSDGNKIELIENELTHIYEEMFHKAVSSYNRDGVEFIAVHRNDNKSGSFVKSIVTCLHEYDLVLADLTGANANVFYELGIRHTLRNGTIILSQNCMELPSDLRQHMTIEYKYHRDAIEFSNYYRQFETQLHDAIQERFENINESDNPVRDFLEVRTEFRNEDRIRSITNNIAIVDLYKEEFKNYIKLTLNMLYCWSRKQESIKWVFMKDLQSFVVKLMNSNERLDIMLFFEKLSFQMRINTHNLEVIKQELMKVGDYKKDALPTYGLSDISGKFHPMYDILHCYKFEDNGTFVSVKQDPIIASFDTVIELWKEELCQISS